MAKSNQAIAPVNTGTAHAQPAAPKVRFAPRTWSPTSIITVNVAQNPKRGDSYARFALYFNGQTVAQYIAAVTGKNGGIYHGPAAKATADLRWDVARGYITIQ